MPATNQPPPIITPLEPRSATHLAAAYNVLQAALLGLEQHPTPIKPVTELDHPQMLRYILSALAYALGLPYGHTLQTTLQTLLPAAQYYAVQHGRPLQLEAIILAGNPTGIPEQPLPRHWNELQEAHDALDALFKNGHPIIQMTDTQRQTAITRHNLLCWALNHPGDESAQVQRDLQHIYTTLRELGFTEFGTPAQ